MIWRCFIIHNYKCKCNNCKKIEKGVKKVFYKGEFLKTRGGDDEPLLTNYKEITKKEYDDFLKSEEGIKKSIYYLANKYEIAKHNFENIN